MPTGLTTLNPAPCRTTTSSEPCLLLPRSAGNVAADAASSDMMELKVSTCIWTAVLLLCSSSEPLAAALGDVGPSFVCESTLPDAGAADPEAAAGAAPALDSEAEARGVRALLASVTAEGAVMRGALGWLKWVSRSFFSSCRTGKASIMCRVSEFVRRWLPARPALKHACQHRRAEQQIDAVVCKCTCTVLRARKIPSLACISDCALQHGHNSLAKATGTRACMVQHHELSDSCHRFPAISTHQQHGDVIPECCHVWVNIHVRPAPHSTARHMSACPMLALLATV